MNGLRKGIIGIPKIYLSLYSYMLRPIFGTERFGPGFNSIYIYLSLLIILLAAAGGYIVCPFF